ncbi:uncharacterized protein NPIL_136041 [Nephila pilipes]|uniref:Uncharacterized protein n=1 Tax=Nephila pilipes TaxID=299642 RepID=A0A8X6Q555_NEPPI|nr:uncharacterized protein NPIL_136041 [Nephila pilipes]
MLHPCPRPCGRLATAAVFVSVGVVQLIAGLILLKSKYVYLLAAPNFWTSASNLAVGSLLGISASVWQNIQRTSFKHAARRNLLAALVFTSIVMNLSTAVILIMGEGNALLSIHLENDGTYSSTTLASEILAYSYATSVCSPIVCIVIAIAFLSGIWFRKRDKDEKSIEIKSILKSNSFDDYEWVFKENQSLLSRDRRIIRNTFSLTSLSSTSEDSYSTTDDTNQEKSGLSVSPISKEIRTPFLERRISQNLPCECGEHVTSIDNNTLYEVNRVSSAEDSGKTLKYQNDSSFPSRRYSHLSGDDARIHQISYCKDDSPLSYTDFKSNHQRFGHFKMLSKRKRMSLEHSALQHVKFTNRNERVQSHNLIPKIHSIQSHFQRKSKSESPMQSQIVAEVHEDPRDFDTQNLSRIEAPLETTLIYDSDRCSYNSQEKSTGNVCHKHANFQRSSTYINSKNPIFHSDESIHEPRFLKVHRTSTTKNSSLISSLEISNIETDHMINQPQCCDHDETEKTRLDNSFHGGNMNASQMESAIDVDDTFFDVPASNNFVGKIIPVQVGAISRMRMHPKLVPVSIPVVSSVKKNQLVNKRKDVITNGIDKVFGRRDVNFSSFRGNVKINSKDNRHLKNIDGVLSCNSKGSETFAPSVTSTEEAPEEKLPPSPAHTSGYDSAFDETVQASCSGNFKPNSSSLSLSSINEDGSFLTTKKKHSTDLSSKGSIITKESPEEMADDLVQIVNKIINRSSITKKKELIAQLMNDISTLKVTAVSASEEKL